MKQQIIIVGLNCHVFSSCIERINKTAITMDEASKALKKFKEVSDDIEKIRKIGLTRNQFHSPEVEILETKQNVNPNSRKYKNNKF